MTRLPILLLTALVAGIGGVANAVEAAGGGAAETRLGRQIDGELAKRQQDEAARRRKLELREAALKAAQARIARGGADKPTTSAVPGPSAGDTADPAVQRFAELAKIYQAMKPARAAAVVERLSPDVQLRIVQQMRSRNAGLIMAQMSPAAAATLSMGLARGRATGPAAAQPRAAPK